MSSPEGPSVTSLRGLLAAAIIEQDVVPRRPIGPSIFTISDFSNGTHSRLGSYDL
jgi:hypothetical protein